jgi:hypothetical protein
MTDPKENPDYHKYADDQVRIREFEDAVGRLRMALFIAALGPIILTLCGIIGIPMAKAVKVAVLGTAPAGILLLILRYAQVPAENRKHKIPMTILLLTIAAAAGTFILAKKFSLFP